MERVEITETDQISGKGGILGGVSEDVLAGGQIHRRVGGQMIDPREEGEPNYQEQGEPLPAR